MIMDLRWLGGMADEAVSIARETGYREPRAVSIYARSTVCIALATISMRDPLLNPPGRTFDYLRT